MELYSLVIALRVQVTLGLIDYLGCVFNLVGIDFIYSNRPVDHILLRLSSGSNPGQGDTFESQIIKVNA